ncbi:MAG TPA: glycosyltransferase family 4 protein, partial [Paraburkholderia sp.]
MHPESQADLRRPDLAVSLDHVNQPTTGRTLRCLWISRDVPFPQDAGDRIYSANMAYTLAEAGVSVCFLGYAGDTSQQPESWSAKWPIETNALASNKRGRFSALLSHLPLAAATHATNEYKALLHDRLADQWDLIVIDSYGSGWALDTCLAAQHDAVQRGARRPTLVYLSHNHEESIWHTMAAQKKGSLPKRVALWQNYLKVRALEHKLVDKVDLISAITDEDAQTYAHQQHGTPTVALTPGYSGWSVPHRDITTATPRNVVLVGSFRWVVKQENLRRFLDLADARFKENDIRFDVIGDVPQALLDELQPKMQATHFHGFVNDIAPYFDAARLAIVPEVIGGGFKLKYLDYLFARVPIATIGEAAAGLPQDIRDNMICRDELAQLVDAIIEAIDQTESLNAMQEQAFTAAQALFDWKDRGLALRQAVEAVAAGRPAHSSVVLPGPRELSPRAPH